LNFVRMHNPYGCRGSTTIEWSVREFDNVEIEMNSSRDGGTIEQLGEEGQRMKCSN
jgi:hypothetical protein